MFLNLIPYLYKLHKLNKNQWCSPSELGRLQFKKLKVLLQHVYYNVDYYRKLFNQAGIKPEDIKEIQDIVKIPITSRKELQALPKEEITAKDVDLNRCLNLRTSGSTGMPLDIFTSAEEIIFRWILYRRMFFENGGKLTDKTMIIASPQNFRAKKWFQRLGILKEKCISIFDDIESQLKTVLEFKPDVIGGYTYASALKNMAIEIKKRNIQGINPRIIFSTAELMTEQDKEFITSVFQSEIIDFYSCNECGIIAWECKKHSGYHINSDNVIVEFIKEDGTAANVGEEGEVVITNLNSYTMPFIRYKLGDRGVYSEEQCPCGRSFPLLKIIAGRYNDCISLPSGSTISPFRLTTAIESFSEVGYYQIIQDREYRIILNIVKKDNISFGTIKKIEKNFRDILGDDIEIVINEVCEIVKEASGKLKVFKSELNNPE